MYDIADLYKADHIIPLAFDVAKRCQAQLEREARQECRRQFRTVKLMERILPDIARVLAIRQAPAEAVAEEYADDAAMPAEWWTPAAVSADLPIGQILKMPSVVAGVESGEPR